MDVLAVDSTVDITCEHSELETKMGALRKDAAAVGNVEVGVWSVWTIVYNACMCLHVRSVCRCCLPLPYCVAVESDASDFKEGERSFEGPCVLCSRISC